MPTLAQPSASAARPVLARVPSPQILRPLRNTGALSMTTEPETSVHKLALSDILIDDKLQVRRKLNDGAVANYTNVYKAGGTMPPLRVARLPGGTLMLVDGWHRLAALKALGEAHVTAEIVETTESGARWEAARANLKHGVPYRSTEFRDVFRAYVSARQHRDKRGTPKSYRDIAQEIGGTRSYSTVRNWMLKDFPKIAAEMAGADTSGTGGLIDASPGHPEDDLLDGGLRGAANAAAAARGMTDPIRRGQLVEGLRDALRIAEEAGPYELSKGDCNDDF